MASRNDKKKLTFIDVWYKWYTDKASHRQHKSDKKLATKKFRKISKEVCRKGEEQNGQ